MRFSLTRNTAGGTKKRGKSLKIDFHRIACITLLSASIDQASKLFVLSRLSEGETIPLIRGIFHITLVYNTGGVFGLFSGFNTVFLLFTSAFLLLLFSFFGKMEKKYPGFFLPGGLIAGGAAGNLADRFRLGCVVDFIDFRIWPVFNIADAAITIGAGLLILKIWIMRKPAGN